MGIHFDATTGWVCISRADLCTIIWDSLPSPKFATDFRMQLQHWLNTLFLHFPAQSFNLAHFRFLVSNKRTIWNWTRVYANDHFHIVDEILWHRSNLWKYSNEIWTILSWTIANVLLDVEFLLEFTTVQRKRRDTFNARKKMLGKNMSREVCAFHYICNRNELCCTRVFFLSCSCNYTLSFEMYKFFFAVGKMSHDATLEFGYINWNG